MQTRNVKLRIANHTFELTQSTRKMLKQLEDYPRLLELGLAYNSVVPMYFLAAHT